MNYAIIVRDTFADNKTDYELKCLDAFYVSPLITMDSNTDINKVLDEFEANFGKYFAHFFSPIYEIAKV